MKGTHLSLTNHSSCNAHVTPRVPDKVTRTHGSPKTLFQHCWSLLGDDMPGVNNKRVTRGIAKLGMWKQQSSVNGRQVLGGDITKLIPKVPSRDEHQLLIYKHDVTSTCDNCNTGTR